MMFQRILLTCQNAIRTKTNIRAVIIYLSKKALSSYSPVLDTLNMVIGYGSSPPIAAWTQLLDLPQGQRRWQPAVHEENA